MGRCEDLLDEPWSSDQLTVLLLRIKSVWTLEDFQVMVVLNSGNLVSYGRRHPRTILGAAQDYSALSN